MIFKKLFEFWKQKPVNDSLQHYIISPLDWKYYPETQIHQALTPTGSYCVGVLDYHQTQTLKVRYLRRYDFKIKMLKSVKSVEEGKQLAWEHHVQLISSCLTKVTNG